MEQVSNFYQSMVENRGKYFENKISKLNDEILGFNSDKEETLMKLDNISTLFTNDGIVEDITSINDRMLEKNKELSIIKTKIGFYDKKSDINKKINSYTQNVIYNNQLAEDDFDRNKNYRNDINNKFNELVGVAYGEKGVLDFEYSSGININNVTGRIKIRCKIEDEKSHGRLYMKINMFDLTWF